MNTVTVAVSLPEDTRDELRAFARAQGVTPSAYMRMVIEQALETGLQVQATLVALSSKSKGAA